MARKTRLPQSPEDREEQMIFLAENMARKQLEEGTASSQVLVHYLKLGTERARLEKEKLKKETELLRAKKDALDSSKRSEELFEKAMDAMRMYTGLGSDDYEK